LDIKKLFIVAAIFIGLWDNGMNISFAQTVPPTEPPPQPPTYPGTGRPTEPQPQPESEPRPHPLRLRPALSVNEVYDDNINLTSSKESDFITSVLPRIGVSYQGIRANLSLDYQADIEFYEDHPDLNTTKHAGNLNAGYRWSPTLNFQLQESFNYSPDATDFNPTGVVSTRTNQYYNSVTAAAIKELSAVTGINLVYSNELQRYEGSSLIDSTVHGIQFSVLHGYTTADTMDVNTGFRYFAFDNPPNEEAHEKVYTLSIGWTHRFSENFSLDVTGGANMYQDLNKDYHPSGLFDLNLRKLWKYAGANLRLAQDLTVSGGVSASTVINRSAVMNIQNNLTKKLRANLSGTYATNESVSGSSVDASSYSGSAGLEYAIADWLKSEIRYTYFQQNSRAAGATDFKRNEVFVGLTASLPER
jgi:hypothetical protein